MSSNIKTRRARERAGNCSMCLQRRRTPGHATCARCRRKLAEYSALRYVERTSQGICVQCAAPASAWLCEPHMERYRQLRRKRAGSRR